MKLKCRLVRIVLVGACSGEPLPGWVEAHLARCEECRAEATASARLFSFLGNHSAVGTCTRTWADLRAELGERRAPRPARSLGLALGVAAACLVAVAIAASVVFWPVRQPVRDRMIVQNPPSTQERRETVRQAVPRHRATAPAIKSVPKRTAPQPVRIRRSVPRRRGLTRPDPSLIADAQPPSPDAKTDVVAIAPEEHVIGVVGVNIDQGNEDHYVIREVSADGDGRAQGVKL